MALTDADLDRLLIRTYADLEAALQEALAERIAAEDLVRTGVVAFALQPDAPVELVSAVLGKADPDAIDLLLESDSEYSRLLAEALVRIRNDVRPSTLALAVGVVRHSRGVSVLRPQA